MSDEEDAEREIISTAAYNRDVQRVVLRAREAYASVNTSGFVPRPLTIDEYMLMLSYFTLGDNLWRQFFDKGPPNLLDDDDIANLRGKIVDILSVENIVRIYLFYTNDEQAYTVAEKMSVADFIAAYPDVATATNIADFPLDAQVFVGTITAGVAGPPGADGADGADGATGPAGPPGADGVCPPCTIDPPIIDPPPPGSRPPGMPPDDTPPEPPEPPPTGGRVSLVCADNPIFGATGTNHTSNLHDYDLTIVAGPVGLIEVHDQYFADEEILTAISTAITNSGELPGGATVTAIVLGYSWIATGNFTVSFSLFNSDILTWTVVAGRSELPSLKVNNGDTSIVLQPSNNYSMFDYSVGIAPISVGKVSWNILEAEETQSLIISEFDKVTSLKLNERLLPALPNFFGIQPTSPILNLCLLGFDYVNDPCGMISGHLYDYTVLGSAAPDFGCWAGVSGSSSGFLQNSDGSRPELRRNFIAPGSNTSVLIEVSGAFADFPDGYVFSTFRAGVRWYDVTNTLISESHYDSALSVTEEFVYHDRNFSGSVSVPSGANTGQLYLSPEPTDDSHQIGFRLYSVKVTMS